MNSSNSSHGADVRQNIVAQSKMCLDPAYQDVHTKHVHTTQYSCCKVSNMMSATVVFMNSTIIGFTLSFSRLLCLSASLFLFFSPSYNHISSLSRFLLLTYLNSLLCHFLLLTFIASFNPSFFIYTSFLLSFVPYSLCFFFIAIFSPSLSPPFFLSLPPSFSSSMPPSLFHSS